MENRALSHLSRALPLAMVITVGFTDHIPVFAQLTPDNTLGAESSIVTPQQLRDLIQGGAIRDNTLFHSFDEFNVGDGRGVFFDLQNNTDILNIFTRVTGGNISNILGTLGVLQDALNSNTLGNANLFLLNPNGISFGPGANLQLNGSFFATTADGFEFDDNFTFSASGEEAPPPLLTISIPRFLSFRDNPQGDIKINQGNLTVNPGENLALVGRYVTVEGGQLNAPGGRIELGGMFVPGNVTFNEDFSLSFPPVVAPSDFTLADATGAANAGRVTINAETLNLRNGVEIVSQRDDFGTPGGITINATESVNIRNGSQIGVSVFAGGRTDGITINAPTVLVDGQLNGARSVISALANGGSFALNNVPSNTGDLEITAETLTLSNGGEIKTQTFGSGSVGSVRINAEESVDITNGGRFLAQVQGPGDVGGIFIDSPNVSLESGDNQSNIVLQVGQNFNSGNNGIGSANDPQNRNSTGNLGGLDINTRTLSLDGNGTSEGVGSQISTVIWGEGSIGDEIDNNLTSILINAEESVIFNNGSLIFARIRSSGNLGNIVINTGNLELNENSLIFNQTGLNFLDDRLDLTDQIVADNEFATGNAGNIILNVDTLSLTHSNPTFMEEDGSKIQSQTFGMGEAGDITINATESISLSSEFTENGDDSQSLILSNFSSQSDLDTGSVRNSGDITINTGSLSLDNGQITASTAGNGNAGDINITAADSVLLENGSSIEAESSPTNEFGFLGNGDGGQITLRAADLDINSGASVVASTEGNGNAGSIKIDVSGTVIIDGEGSGVFASTSADSPGNAGSINIDPEQVTIRNGGVVSVDSQGTGTGGNITIVSDRLRLDNGRITAESANTNDKSGSITLNVSDFIWLLNGNGTLDDEGNSFPLISTDSQGNGGDITINTVALLTIGGQDSDITSNSDTGQGGQITINADAVFWIDESDEDSPNSNDINVRSGLGSEFSGQVIFNTPETNPGEETIEQPEEVVDSSDIVSQSVCSDFGGNNQLSNTGRGGIPPTPELAIRSEVVDVDLVDEVLLPPPPPEAIKPHHRTDVTFLDSNGEEFKPAMGAVLLPNGMVEFVDYNPAEVYRDMYAAAGCSH